MNEGFHIGRSVALVIYDMLYDSSVISDPLKPQGL